MTSGAHLLAIALAASSAVGAAGDLATSAGKSAEAPRELLQQKEAFVKRMLEDSSAVQRIQASEHAKAKRYLAAAQASYRSAAIALERGDLVLAEQQLNEATRLAAAARQLVPDPATRDHNDLLRYEQLLASVESLGASYRRHMHHATPAKGTSARASGSPLAWASQLVVEARAHAAEQRIVQANRALAEAERTFMLALGRVLGTRTLEYTLRFQSSAEEFAYELERNRSYEQLIPIAVAQFKPASDATRTVQNLVESSRKLRSQGQRHAADRDHTTALAAVRRATADLERALSVAGLRLPRETASDMTRR